MKFCTNMPTFNKMMWLSVSDRNKMVFRTFFFVQMYVCVMRFETIFEFVVFSADKLHLVCWFFHKVCGKYMCSIEIFFGIESWEKKRIFTNKFNYERNKTITMFNFRQQILLNITLTRFVNMMEIHISVGSWLLLSHSTFTNVG